MCVKRSIICSGPCPPCRLSATSRRMITRSRRPKSKLTTKCTSEFITLSAPSRSSTFVYSVSFWEFFDKYLRVFSTKCLINWMKTAFSNDYDYPDYDADYEDEQWLNENRSVLPDDFSEDLLLYFETIMDRLEKATAHSSNVTNLFSHFISSICVLHFSTNLIESFWQIMTVEEAKLLLMKEASGSGETDPFYQANISIHTAKQLQHKSELEKFLLLIYEYWKKKRTLCVSEQKIYSLIRLFGIASFIFANRSIRWRPLFSRTSREWWHSPIILTWCSGGAPKRCRHVRTARTRSSPTRRCSSWSGTSVGRSKPFPFHFFVCIK